jgi:3-oxoacyl-[acyl-carrier protein] reductase
MIDLSGRNVLITGGSRGIGAACAILFARAGADVGIIYAANAQSARRVASEVRNLGKKAVTLKADVSKMDECRKVVGAFVRESGSVDILVNSAGIWEYAPAERMTDRNWKRTMSVNLDGTMQMIRAALPSMLARKQGVIINIASTAGQRGEAEHSHYAASKGAVIALTKSLAVELIGRGIRVNCVSPGWVDTDMVAGTLKKRGEMKKILDAIPRGCVATAMDVAGPVLFLASDLSVHMVGANLSVNGGSVLD